MQLSSEFFAYITTVRLHFLHVIKSLPHPPGPAWSRHLGVDPSRPWHTSIPTLWLLVQRTPRDNDAAQQVSPFATWPQSHNQASAVVTVVSPSRCTCAASPLTSQVI